MVKPVETTRTATHDFWIIGNRYGMGEFMVEYRPLNPKTGEPWQASRRVTHGADVEPKGWEGRPIAYSTLEEARLAMAQQIERLKR